MRKVLAKDGDGWMPVMQEQQMGIRQHSTLGLHPESSSLEIGTSNKVLLTREKKERALMTS